MPYDIERRKDRYCVVKDSDGEVMGCHDTRSSAEEQLQALYANEADASGDTVTLQSETHMEDTPETVVQETTHYSWSGPITFEGVYTGDGRLFRANSVTWRNDLLPFPFDWQRLSSDGHDSSVTIGRVDEITRGEDGQIFGRGVILRGENAPPEAAQYIALLEEGAAGWVSIDGDDAKFDILEDEENPFGMKMEFDSINIRGLTAVNIAAFAEAKIALVDESVVVADGREGVVVSDGEVEYARTFVPREWIVDDEALIASIPINPPIEWFDDPKFDSLTPITITDDGRVFGHLCGKETCHIGMGSCRTSPRNCDYDNYFHLGCIKTEEGNEVFVGHMTFGGGHAPLDKAAQSAAAYYDSTSRVSADIRCGEDEFGTWVVGALRPTLSQEDIREIRSAPLSGDWRPIGGKLQLIAAHAVNVPGFPVPRAKVMVASGVTETLILTDECNCDVAEQWAKTMFDLELDDLEEQIKWDVAVIKRL